MKQMTEEQQKLVKELGLLGRFFTWMDKHEKVTDILLLLQIIALVWVIFTYNFTTQF